MVESGQSTGYLLTQFLNHCTLIENKFSEVFYKITDHTFSLIFRSGDILTIFLPANRYDLT